MGAAETATDPPDSVAAVAVAAVAAVAAVVVAAAAAPRREHVTSSWLKALEFSAVLASAYAWWSIANDRFNH